MAVLTATGITFSDSTQLNSRTGIFPTSTAWVYFQAAAPTGWTKVITQDNKALRVVSGTGGGAGGTSNFTTIMSSFTISGTLSSSNLLGSTILSTAATPTHAHPSNGTQLNANPATFNPDGSQAGYSGGDVRRPVPQGTAGQWVRNSPVTGAAGSTQGHDHPFSGTGTVSAPVNIAVQYIDMLVCTFNG